MLPNLNDFSSFEFNLYKLLNISTNATCEEASKSFKKIVKKFHPDKISKLEEKIYEYIVIAYQVLSNKELKEKYDNFLFNSSKSHSSLKDDFNNKNINNYFPKDKREATSKFLEQSRELRNRHGEIKQDNLKLDTKLKTLNKNRNNKNVKVKRDDHITKNNFNTVFTERKDNGTYSDKIIKIKNQKITPYQSQKNKLNYVDLEDFNKLYLEDSVQTSDYTSLDRAFLLQPNMKVEKERDTDTTYKPIPIKNNFKDLDHFLS